MIDDFTLPLSRPASETAQTGDRYEIKAFICRLDGYKTRIKNIHWSSKLLPYIEKNKVHEHMDEILDLVSDYEDVIAENYMGSFGVLPMGFLRGEQPETNDPMELLDVIKKDLEGFHERYSSSAEYIGMINATEDLLQNLPVKKYLLDQCK